MIATSHMVLTLTGPLNIHIERRSMPNTSFDFLQGPSVELQETVELLRQQHRVMLAGLIAFEYVIHAVEPAWNGARITVKPVFSGFNVVRGSDAGSINARRLEIRISQDHSQVIIHYINMPDVTGTGRVSSIPISLLVDEQQAECHAAMDDALRKLVGAKVQGS